MSRERYKAPGKSHRKGSGLLNSSICSRMKNRQGSGLKICVGLMKKGIALVVGVRGLKPFPMKTPCLIIVETAVNTSALKLER